MLFRYLASMNRLSFWLTLAAFAISACGDDDGPTDSGSDAETDVPTDALPDGPRGEVLSIEETVRRVLPTLSGEVYVLRTEADVPHVYAENERDLRVVQGYVMARDRYFQIEAGRRLAQGRLSELIGDGALSGDQGARGRGMTAIAERLVSLLTPEQEVIVDAYVEGVNAYIEAASTGQDVIPTEISVVAPLLGMRAGDIMQPLTRADLIAFAAVPIFQLGFETGDLVYADSATFVDEQFPTDTLRREGLRDDLFTPIAPINNVSSAPGFGVSGEVQAHVVGQHPEGPIDTDRLRRSRGLGHLAMPTMERGVLERVLARNDAFEDDFRGGRWNDFGSNAWATRPDLGDGAAILSGDGHLPLSIAPLFYQMGLDTSVFGDDAEPTTLMGLFFAAIPPMAVGTNGRVAWSQTYLRGDVTDWYAEEIILNSDGVPVGTVFNGSTENLVVRNESYEIANIPTLMSTGRTETWDRYETFDGRFIAGIEGRPAMADTVVGAGETLVNIQGEYIIPMDMNNDGVVSGISFDYTGFDVSNILRALDNFNRSDNVAEFHQATRELVTYAQNLVAADIEGNVFYGSYNAMPSRAHLPREAGGAFEAGANPRGLIDGTRFGAFEVRLDANGMPDNSACGSEPQTCLVPFERWPTSFNPAEGFVLTANNDIANLTQDNTFDNDEYYLGGPWNNGFRGETIRRTLAELGSTQSVSSETMQALQGDHTSVMGQLFAPFLLSTIDEVRTLSEGSPSNPEEMRLVALYGARSSEIDEVQMRLQAWLDRGATAESGVETFYNQVDANERADAVATMIFNVWYRALLAGTFGDENIAQVFAPDPRTMTTRAMIRLLRARGANSENLASYEDAERESIFFDVMGTPERETSREVIIQAIVSTLERLAAEPPEDQPGVGGFGTTNMDEWLWGLRHQVTFNSIITDFVGDDPSFALLANNFSITTRTLPLAENIPDGDPRANLKWFPRPGDLFNVDAAHTSLTPGSDFFYSNGPVMRMVIRLEEGNVSGVNILPGGQSGRSRDPHFADQAALWLGNNTVPLRFEVSDVVAGASARETYAPAE